MSTLFRVVFEEKGKILNWEYSKERRFCGEKIGVAARVLNFSKKRESWNAGIRIRGLGVACARDGNLIRSIFIIFLNFSKKRDV